MCNLLWLLTSSAFGAAGGTCVAQLSLPQGAIDRPFGPRCLTAATAIALSAHPDAPTESALARSVRITPDGIDPFDLQQALTPLGWDSLVFTGPPEAAARLVEAGLAPVAMVDLGRGRKHAVTVTGAERVPAADGTCTTALARLQTIDPRDGTPRWETAQDFTGRQWAHQLVVVYRPEDAERLDDAGFPVETAREINARFRAEGYLRRAQAHPSPNAQSVRLLEQAVAADPAWAPARQALERHRAAVSASALGSP